MDQSVFDPSSRSEVAARLKTEIRVQLKIGNISADKDQSMAYE